MELLEFKNKIFDLLQVEKTSDIGEKLLSCVLNNDIDTYVEFLNITDDTKDWLQALWQYYEADRTEKKQDYTPKSLCKLVSALIGDCKTIYDCCGGSGALTVQCLCDKEIDKVYVEELDDRVIPFLLFNLCLRNAEGVVINGDVLSGERKKVYALAKGERFARCYECDVNIEISADVAISNPPYNIKWEAPAPIFADERFPVIPPASNANYAFVLNCISRADKAVLILPNGIGSERTELEVRKHLVDNDLIETVIVMPEKMFEATSISTCVLVLNKQKQYKGEICFIDSRKNCVIEEREQNGQFGGKSHTNRTYKKAYNILTDEHIEKILNIINGRENIAEFSEIVSNQKVAENEYLLIPSRYIKFVEQEIKHRNFQEIADDYNKIVAAENSCKLVINETIAKTIGLDVDGYKKAVESSKQMAKNQKAIGIELICDDYIQFTKNKNEIVFKNNSKDDVSLLLLEFIKYWAANQKVLFGLEQQYLIELRDALLPDLMSGKIKL